MSVRTWLAVILVSTGVFGILGAIGLVDTGAIIGEWWPVAVIGWGVFGIVAARRITVGDGLLLLVGLALLADEQGWAAGSAVWAILISVLGLAVLFGRGHRFPTGRRRRAGSS